MRNDEKLVVVFWENYKLLFDVYIDEIIGYKGVNFRESLGFWCSLGGKSMGNWYWGCG